MKYKKPSIKVIKPENTNSRSGGGIDGASNSGCGMCKVFK